jgi:hypothetical protein
MEKIWLKTLAFIILIFSVNGLLAQNSLTKLDHVQLMKQFLGNWKAELGQDSVGTLICKSFYNGFDFYFKIEVKGKTVFEEKTLSGYDKKYDKLIKIWIQNTDPEFGMLALWFTTPSRCEEVLFEDIDNPASAKYKWIFDFKSPDLLIWSDLLNNKVTSTYAFNRIK